MRRADRLFEIIQVLRRASRPQTASEIAAKIETSQRTVYRDIAALIGQRVPIRGEAGVGYVLERGFDLPPLMLTPDEIEAVVLGSQWVIAHADPSLARAAVDVLAKVAHVLPKGLRDVVDEPTVGTPPTRHRRATLDVDVRRLRAWCREGRKLALRYVDEQGTTSERTVWPFLIGYVSTMQVLVAWCELREDFRYFRTDRLLAVSFLDTRYPERRASLRRRWTEQRETEEAERARGDQLGRGVGAGGRRAMR
ncbi:MAG: YafY family transcriptional regulator [Deltaproteobacteria bacterium]|nr:YafY family transcriptional regulator [Deltaproteobacteria bacterium]